MDLEDSGIDIDPKSHSDLEVSTPNEPIITFSPDRCRFDTGKSRNSSITSDFELSGTLEVVYSGDEVEPSSNIQAMTDLLTNSVGGVTGVNSNGPAGGPPTSINNNINSSTTTNSKRLRNSSSSNATSLELQKRLEKQIAQATMTNLATNEPKSEEEETEFGEWNTHPQQKQPNLNHNNNNQNSNNSSSEEAKKTSLTKAALNTFQEFEVDEVEVITKCSRGTSSSGFDVRKQSGLIPPERLAIPHKGHSNSNRKHSSNSKPDSKGQNKKQIPNNPNPPEAANPPGSTSENKPLVQWDSDESEEELSFYPAAKSRAKLTDNLSIDNMSLSGEEDDLHLSPPRQLTRKCPCDPRPWIQEHLPKTPAGGTVQCCIT